MTNQINLSKGFISLDVLIFKEDEYFIAFVPALNITSHSKIQKKAKSQIDGAVKLFFDHWGKKGELHDKLSKLGWRREGRENKLTPKTESMSVPYSLINKKYEREYVRVRAVS